MAITFDTWEESRPEACEKHDVAMRKAIKAFDDNFPAGQLQRITDQEAFDSARNVLMALLAAINAADGDCKTKSKDRTEINKVAATSMMLKEWKKELKKEQDALNKRLKEMQEEAEQENKAKVTKFIKFRLDFVGKMQEYLNNVKAAETRVTDTAETADARLETARELAGEPEELAKIHRELSTSAKNLSALASQLESRWDIFLRSSFEEHRGEGALLSEWKLTTDDVKPHLSSTWKQMEVLRNEIATRIRGISTKANNVRLAADEVESLGASEEKRITLYLKMINDLSGKFAKVRDSIRQLFGSASVESPDDRVAYLENKYKSTKGIEPAPEDGCIKLAQAILKKLDDNKKVIDKFYAATMTSWTKLNRAVPQEYREHPEIGPNWNTIDGVVRELKDYVVRFEQNEPALFNGVTDFIKRMERAKS